ncbi:MAG: polysaccharide deacetylase family protein, partial [Chitinophagaceae bacterium]
MPGILNISLDFELHWGVFDKKQLDAPGKRYFENTRRVIPQMIALFRQYEAHVTWAVVGMLYHPNAHAWRQHVPPRLPAYQNPAVSSYRWVEENELLEPSDPYHFAPDLIALLEQEPLFEIGTHTYSHYYCQEAGQTPEQFESDLQKAIEMAQSRGHQLRSLVFPRNQFNPAYLQVCRDKGIETVRSNPDVWYWDAARPEGLLKKLFRTGDAYTTVLG